MGLADAALAAGDSDHHRALLIVLSERCDHCSVADAPAERAAATMRQRLVLRAASSPPASAAERPIAASGILDFRSIGTAAPGGRVCPAWGNRSEEHTSELQYLMRRSNAAFCLKK